MKDIKDYLEQTDTVLLTKDAFEWLKERASALDKIRAEIKEQYSGCGLINDGLDMALSIIDKYMTESTSEIPNKWIPVSERLPKPFSYVNCTCHSLVDDREDWVVETCYLPQPPDSPYSDWGNIPMLNWGECEVIAWMYRDIPEPYKAESEDTECYLQ